MTAYDDLRSGLASTKVPIRVLCPDSFKDVRDFLDKNPSIQYVSEWQTVPAGLNYLYCAHGTEGSRLRELFESGVRGGNPRVIQVYTRTELEELIMAQTPSDSVQHN